MFDSDLLCGGRRVRSFYNLSEKSCDGLTNSKHEHSPALSVIKSKNPGHFNSVYKLAEVNTIMDTYIESEDQTILDTDGNLL